MLTLDLLRYRVTGESVTPIYLTLTGGRKYVDMAETLIGIFRGCVGRTVGELDAEIEETLGGAPDYKVYRGLAKIMYDYVLSEPASDVNAEELRKLVFTRAARDGALVRKSDLIFHASASDKAGRIAADLGMDAETLLGSLYADLPDSRVIRAVDERVTAVELIERYNTALAQAMLYRATRLIMEVRDNYRQVFKHIKLARLMHAIKPLDEGYRIEIDGPLSLFSNVERYGINMARLLPAVLKCEKWRLAAKVHVADGEKLFRLGPQTGLKSHYRDEPVFDSSAEEAFFTKFSRNTKSKWRIEREGSIIDLKDTVMIPDFKFTHKDGRVVHLEIVGFWTPEYLAKKLDKLARAKETVVIAAPESLNCADEEFGGPVVRYKQRLLIKDVLPALDTATKPQEADDEN